MQDIGGCRTILPSMDAVEDLLDRYQQAARHTFKSSDDYVSAPKIDGYRGHHLVYRYSGHGPFSAYSASPMLIELQIRTRLQHAWATAVEAVGMLLNEDMKGGEGDPDWRRFFALMATEFAEDEGCPPVPGTSDNVMLRRQELQEIDHKLSIVQSLEAVRQAVQRTIGIRRRISGAFIVSLDRQAMVTSITPVTGSASKDTYTRAEADQARISVLVEADRADDLAEAYPNYFLDIGVFTERARRAVRRPQAPTTLSMGQILERWQLDRKRGN